MGKSIKRTTKITKLSSLSSFSPSRSIGHHSAEFVIVAFMLEASRSSSDPGHYGARLHQSYLLSCPTWSNPKSGNCSSSLSAATAAPAAPTSAVSSCAFHRTGDAVSTLLGIKVTSAPTKHRGRILINIVMISVAGTS